MDFFNFEKLKEHKQHGDIMLPIALYPVTHNAMGSILPYHWHNELEFIYLANGQAVFTIDDEDFTVNAGECIFINGGQIHSGFSRTEDSTYFSVVFATELLTNSLDAGHNLFAGIKTNKFKLVQHFNPEDPTHYKVICAIEDIVKELSERNMAFELVIKCKLFSIFSIIFRKGLYTTMQEAHKISFNSKRYDTLKKIMGYIYQNYNKKIKLEDIGEHVNLTPQYVCKFFKEMTNTKIIDYINHYRIETASTLLKGSTLNITDVALECGFDNLSYFNRVFKKQAGCTPTEFRNISLNIL